MFLVCRIFPQNTPKPAVGLPTHIQWVREFFPGGAAPWATKGKGKGKAIPLQARTVPEGSRRLRFPDFKTICT
jgi:hypothetical protein